MSEEWEIEEHTPTAIMFSIRTSPAATTYLSPSIRLRRVYEVRTQAATPTEVKPDEVKGPLKTLEEAKEMAHAESKKWDEVKGKLENDS